jgi:hypothetical protein
MASPLCYACVHTSSLRLTAKVRRKADAEELATLRKDGFASANATAVPLGAAALAARPDRDEVAAMVQQALRQRDKRAAAAHDEGIAAAAAAATNALRRATESGDVVRGELLKAVMWSVCAPYKQQCKQRSVLSCLTVYLVFSVITEAG